MTQHYDVLIRDTTIVDGSGVPAFRGSVAICGEKIAAVGKVEGSAATVIEGSGLVTCPGFVDPHSHADVTILNRPLADSMVMQGITTFVGGNCGLTPAPVTHGTAHFRGVLGTWYAGADLAWRTFDEWLSTVERARPAVNFVPQVGHNTIRATVMGDSFRQRPTPAQLEEMSRLVAEAMEAGAFALSIGLDYWPGEFAEAAEIVELAKVSRQYGGLLTAHTRHHLNRWPAADPEEYGYSTFQAPTGEIIAGRYHGLLEAVEIAKKAGGIPLQIAHLTPAYLVPQPHPAFLDEALARATLVDIVDKARQEGLDLTYNVIAWSQSLGYLEPIVDSFFNPRLPLPEWMTVLGRAGFVERLKETAFRDAVKEVVFSRKFKFGGIVPVGDPYWMDCFRILRCRDRQYEGKTIGEIARERAPDNILQAVYQESIDVVFDILLQDPEALWAEFVDKREAGVLPVFLQHPAGMPCTDSGFFPFGTPGKDVPLDVGVPPISYALYPHYINEFVKERAVLSLEEAIKKATSLPAQEVFGLQDRGIIREGAYADIVVFDLERIREGGDFWNPTQPPEGIAQVLVNGTPVFHEGRHTGARPGKVLRHRPA